MCTEELISELEKAAEQAREVYSRVNKEKEEAAKVRAAEFKKAEDEAKRKRIYNIIGSLSKKIISAANNGFNYVDIGVDEADVVRSRGGVYTDSFKVGSKSYEAYGFLRGVKGINPTIYEEKHESTGSYGEREQYSTFCIRVRF